MFFFGGGRANSKCKTFSPQELKFGSIMLTSETPVYYSSSQRCAEEEDNVPWWEDDSATGVYLVQRKAWNSPDRYFKFSFTRRGDCTVSFLASLEYHGVNFQRYTGSLISPKYLEWRNTIVTVSDIDNDVDIKLAIIFVAQHREVANVEVTFVDMWLCGVTMYKSIHEHAKYNIKKQYQNYDV